MPVKHIVLFKFKEAATEVQIEEIKAALTALDSRKGAVPPQEHGGVNVLGDCWESGGSGVRSLEDGPGYGVKVSLRTGSMPLEVSDILLFFLARQGRPLTGILSPTTDTSNLRPDHQPHAPNPRFCCIKSGENPHRF